MVMNYSETFFNNLKILEKYITLQAMKEKIYIYQKVIIQEARDTYTQLKKKYESNSR